MSGARIRMGFRGAAALAATIAIVGLSGAANAITLTSLRDSGLSSIYGSYAPGGNCAGDPVVTISDAGLSFRIDGQVTRPARFDHSVTFFGPGYSGISQAFFPFPIGPGNPGRVMMFVNADEKRGVIRFDGNLAPGQKLTAREAKLVKSSPLLLCRKKRG